MRCADFYYETNHHYNSHNYLTIIQLFLCILELIRLTSILDFDLDRQLESHPGLPESDLDLCERLQSVKCILSFEMAIEIIEHYIGNTSYDYGKKGEDVEEQQWNSTPLALFD